MTNRKALTPRSAHSSLSTGPTSLSLLTLKDGHSVCTHQTQKLALGPTASLLLLLILPRVTLPRRPRLRDASPKLLTLIIPSIPATTLTRTTP
eukprot:1647854-Pleurochrysis_carterae.AAC.1